MAVNAKELDDLILEEDLEAEAPDAAIEPGRRNIFTDSADPTIEVLYQRFKDGDLHLQPDFQRHFVWDTVRSSRLIESVLIRVPLPIIYLAEEEDGKESVIDGQQRLTSFFNFIDGKFPLRGLRVEVDLNGKKFVDLDKARQRTIRKTAVRTITIRSESDKDLKFDIYERLNTGSVALNDQELRNCVYRGPYNELLCELASDEDFKLAVGLKGLERRMRDVELVLRFAAFSHTSYLNYRPSMKRFLNNDMEEYRNISNQQAAELRQAFRKSVQLVRTLLGRHAFRRFYRGEARNPCGSWEGKQLNISLYDMLMYGFTGYEKNQVMPHLDAMREALVWLMTEDDQFIETIELSTSSARMITQRFDKWRHVLREIVGQPRRGPRCFSRQLKEDLYRQEPTCALCGQHIADVDDAAIDHIKQYWLGGRTIPENARLTHRYCNWSRPRREAAQGPSS